MPVLNFGPVTGSSGIQTELTIAAIARSLGRVRNRSGITASVSIAGRLRGPAQPLTVQINGSAVADLKRLARFGPAQAISGIRTLVQYFIDATATPAPFGRLLIPTIEQISNPAAAARGFNGLRFVKGNTVPIEFTIRGQRLDGFNATFTACRTDQPIGSPHDIEKTAPAQIRQTPPVRDTATGMETMTGVIQLVPSDTSGLPDGEFEYVFEFKLDDGNGRVHTLETGRFKVYSVC